MKKFYLSLFLLFLGCIYIQGAVGSMLGNTNEPTLNDLVLDENQNTLLPRHFRTTSSSFKPTSLVPSRKGLAELRCSGSGQFSEKNILEASRWMSGPIWIVDLRRESHGFIQGLPISWYLPKNKSNLFLSTDEILQNEHMLLEHLKNISIISVKKILEKRNGKIVNSNTVSLASEGILSELELSQKLSFGYCRFPVSDHQRPDDETVESFVQFIKDKPNDVWLHFHCRAGKGRTTTFMVMYDMLMNAKSLSQDTIIRRQALLGGSTLTQLETNAQSYWKHDAQVERKAFIEEFYQYASHPLGYPNATWTQWLRRNQ